MAVIDYNGHDHYLQAGGLVRHIAVGKDGVRLRVADDTGGDAEVLIAPDELVRLASTLLRDQQLATRGGG